MEICVGLGLGIIGSVGLRGAMQKDLDAFQPKKAGGSAKPAKTMSADEKADVAKFEAWAEKQRAASPPDAKDTDDFKYINFTEFPPFHKGHKSLMRKLLTPELFEKYKNVKSSKGFTFSNAIQCGVMKPHLGVGITAGDEECF